MEVLHEVLILCGLKGDKPQYYMNHKYYNGGWMASKIIQLITKVDTIDYMIIKEALQLYDEYLHSVPDLRKAIKVRAIMQELKELRKVRKI